MFANLDGLFAFHTSAEDAQYLVRELGDEIDEQDLISLGEHQCYVKLSAGGQRLPTFSVRLDPPPLSDPVVGDGLAAASAALYGREWTRVENDLNSALQRIELSHRMPQDGGLAGEGGTGVARDVAGRTDPQGGRRADERQERNDQRRQRPNRTQTHQGTLFNTLAMSEGASDVAPLPADVDSHAHMDAGEPLV
ncbi:MAG: hypothetical protein NTZ05_07125 [Chloroflexi bacterium]|nr:hypothetical protein [Chloroflexota bacterium]